MIKDLQDSKRIDSVIQERNKVSPLPFNPLFCFRSPRIFRFVGFFGIEADGIRVHSYHCVRRSSRDYSGLLSSSLRLNYLVNSESASTPSSPSPSHPYCFPRLLFKLTHRTPVSNQPTKKPSSTSSRTNDYAGSHNSVRSTSRSN